MNDEPAETGDGARIPEPTRRPPVRPDRRMLEILVCPLTRGRLEYVADRGLLISRAAGVAFPIRDGIPIMIVEEALPLDTLDEIKN